MDQTFIQKLSSYLDSFIKKYRFPLLFLISISLLYVFPILLANVYYVDDMRRSTTGVGWDYDGRIFATFLMKKLTGGGGISDFFPYSIIFSAILIALAGHIISCILGLEKNNKYKLSALILLINPFFLENLSYRWDSIPMAISVCSVIVPFLFLSRKYLFVLISIIGICISMLTYQTSIVIYPILVLLVIIKLCFSDKKDKQIFNLIIISFTSFCLALVFYKIIGLLFPIRTGGREEMILFNDNFLLLLENNIGKTFLFVKSAFSRYYSLLFLIILVISVIAYSKYLFSDRSILKKILIPFLFLFVVFFIVFPLLFLYTPVFMPRMMVGFSFVIYFILLLTNYLNSRLVTFISFLFLLVSLPLVSSYASGLKSQNNLEIFVAQNIARTVDVNNKTLAFYGQLEYSEEIHVALRKFPILNYLVPSNMKNQTMWGEKIFMKANNYMYTPNFLPSEEYADFISKRDEIPIIDETRYYILRADSRRVVVDFTKSR